MKAERKKVVVYTRSRNLYEPVKICCKCDYHEPTVVVKYETGTMRYYCYRDFKQWRNYGAGWKYKIEYINRDVKEVLQ